jgi:glutamine---fructose-6-phosphate transaminase (isomerizing)
MDEIAGQPAAMRRAAAGLSAQLPAFERIRDGARGRSLVFTAMGGSFAVCHAPVTQLARVGIGPMMVEAAELLYFRRRTVGPHHLVVAVSQSGESAEVVRLGKSLAEDGDRPFLVSVTNGLDNSLARLADVALDTCAGAEHGPSTLTYCSALVVLSELACVLAGEAAVTALEQLEAKTEHAANAVGDAIGAASSNARRLRDWLSDRSTLSLLARGAARAAAEMGALTLKEAAQFPAESMETAQFRHGPLELAGGQAAAIVIATEDATRELDVRLAAKLVATGTAVLLITSVREPLAGAENVAIGEVDRALAPGPAIVPIQLLAWQLAHERGLDPGSYTIAKKVTTSE